MKLRLKRLTGSWDPYIPNTDKQLHFGPTHFTDVPNDIRDPLRAAIIDEIERGVMVDERGINPFVEQPEEKEVPVHIIDSCYLSEDEYWPCLYSVGGSCPEPCIHDQTPPEEKDTGYTCTDCGGNVQKEATACPHCGETFDENEAVDDSPTEPPEGTVDTPLTPLGKALVSLPKDFDEAMERIGNLSYNDVRDFARQEGINVKASGKKVDIVKRIRDRLFEVWGE